MGLNHSRSHVHSIMRQDHKSEKGLGSKGIFGSVMSCVARPLCLVEGHAPLDREG